MKKEKGFTLVEVIGVITIIAVLSLLIVPYIFKDVNNSKEQLYKTQIKEIENACKSWITNNLSEIPPGKINTKITLGCLKIEGLLKNNIINPLTKTDFPNDMIINITTENNQYNCNVISDTGTNNNLPSDKCSYNDTLIDS